MAGDARDLGPVTPHAATPCLNGPVPWTALPGATPPAPVGDTLDRVLKRLGAPTSAGISVVFDRWCDVVGESMAARTRPLTIDRQTLVVACDDPALATHVRFLEPQLVARLAELAGERQVTRVEVRVDRTGGRRRPPRRAPRRG
jgi:predicted nucleic acid-binding Zn ribbon protein